MKRTASLRTVEYCSLSTCPFIILYKIPKPGKTSDKIEALILLSGQLTTGVIPIYDLP